MPGPKASPVRGSVAQRVVRRLDEAGQDQTVKWSVRMAGVAPAQMHAAAWRRSPPPRSCRETRKNPGVGAPRACAPRGHGRNSRSRTPGRGGLANTWRWAPATVMRSRSLATRNQALGAVQDPVALRWAVTVAWPVAAPGRSLPVPSGGWRQTQGLGAKPWKGGGFATRRQLRTGMVPCTLPKQRPGEGFPWTKAAFVPCVNISDTSPRAIPCMPICPKPSCPRLVGSWSRSNRRDGGCIAWPRSVTSISTKTSGARPGWWGKFYARHQGP